MTSPIRSIECALSIVGKRKNNKNYREAVLKTTWVNARAFRDALVIGDEIYPWSPDDEIQVTTVVGSPFALFFQSRFTPEDLSQWDVQAGFYGGVLIALRFASASYGDGDSWSLPECDDPREIEYNRKNYLPHRYLIDT